MSEFSKLATRVDSVFDEITAIDSGYADAILNREGYGEKRKAAVESMLGSIDKLSVPVAASQTISTTTAATPGIRNQYAWRSTSSANPDRDQYLSEEGQQLFADYDAVQKLHEEVSTKLAPSCDNFVLKANTKDSVTDLPRYGVAMRAKIMASADKSTQSLKLSTDLMQKLAGLVEFENMMRKNRKETAEKEALEHQQQILLAASLQEMVSPNLI
jgi:hypothetical protein